MTNNTQLNTNVIATIALSGVDARGEIYVSEGEIVVRNMVTGEVEGGVLPRPSSLDEAIEMIDGSWSDADGVWDFESVEYASDADILRDAPLS